jgi:hypothetical protein
MSSPTWTPAALSSEARRLAGRAWRLVEAQHRVSTLKLVDDLDEQAVLEALLKETKPLLPAECRGLGYLLATPFRYAAAYPRGSRFRRAGRTAGVFYASETAATAVAEMAFWRLLFFVESPATPWPADAAEYTAFAALFDTERAIDLARPPLDADAAASGHPTDYAACQALADAARAADVEAIRYRSGRDPGRGGNLALLTCRAFAAPEPVERQTWRIRLGRTGVHAICEFPAARIGFDRATFAADPRIAALRWER